MLPQVTFRGLSSSVEIKEAIHKKTQKLSTVIPALRGCHVVIEAFPADIPNPPTTESRFISAAEPTQTTACRVTAHTRICRPR